MSKKDTTPEIERRYIQNPVKVEKRDDDETEFAVVEGYAAVFNKRTMIGGWYEEEILPGAFDDVLKDDVRCLINHDPNLILARSVNGKGTLELFVDETGLGYRYTTPDVTYARDLQKNIELGNISQSSFSFIVDETVWHSRDGEPDLRQIKKVKCLFDVSPVTYPAYADATVGKRTWEARKAEIKQESEKTDHPSKKLDEYEARYMFNLNNSKR